MSDNHVTLIETEELEGDLRRLREIKAPRTLMPQILARVGLTDSYFSIQSAIGQVFVAYNGRGISAVIPAGDRPAFEQAFGERFGRSVQPAIEPPASLQQAVIAQLEGKRRVLRFDLRGLSEFEQAVLRKALEIPRGEVRPYSWVAREIGRPRAVRAVGSALAHNPIPLLIPCHRVVRSGGEIGQYAFGVTSKRAMLAAEGTDPDELEELARAGVRYIGSDTTRIFCFPACRHARRITSRHRHTFRSEGEAVGAGFRACRVCRPLAVAQ